MSALGQKRTSFLLDDFIGEVYSTTSSARPSNLGGTSTPSDLATLELIAM